MNRPMKSGNAGNSGNGGGGGNDGMKRRSGGTIRSVRMGLLAFAAAACATGATRERDASESLSASVAEIAGELVHAVEVRTDVSRMRVLVHEVLEGREEAPYALRTQTTTAQSAQLARELEHELVLALSSRLNLLAVDQAERGAQAAPQESMQSRAERFGATHALVGEFVREGDDLLVTVRLIDTENLLIVGVARGLVPLESLQGGRRVTEAAAEPEASIVPTDVARTGVVAAASPAPSGTEPVSARSYEVGEKWREPAGRAAAPEAAAERQAEKTEPEAGAATATAAREPENEPGKPADPPAEKPAPPPAEPRTEELSVVRGQGPAAERLRRQRGDE